MKRFTAFILAAVVSASSVFASDITVTLDGDRVEFSAQEPVIENGRTLIPLRGVFEQLGYEISFDAETKTAFFTKDGSTIEITANGGSFVIDGEAIPLEVPASIINGSMMLPLRAVGEAAGLTVDWDSETKTVSLSKEAPAETADEASEEAAAADTAENTEITAEDYAALETAAEDTADIVACQYLLMSYEIYINNFDFKGGNYNDLIDDVQNVTDIYRTELANINLSDSLSDIEEQYNKFFDLYEGYTVTALELYNLSDSDEFSEKHDSLITYMEETRSFQKTFKDSIEKGVENVLSNDSLTKFIVSESPSDSETAEYYRYMMEIIGFLKMDGNLVYIMNNELNDLTKEDLDGAADDLREKLNSMEPPVNCMYIKHLLLKACDLLNEAGDISENGEMDYSPSDGSYVKYYYNFGAAYAILQIVSGNTNEWFDNILDEVY